MRKITFILCLFVTGLMFSQTVIYQESFETDANGTNYNTSIPEFSDGGGDYFTRTDGSNIGTNVEITGIDGSYFFGAQDIDGGATLPVSLSTISVDVSSLNSVDFVIALAEDADGSNLDWDNSDYVHITYALDGGADQNLLWIESNEDNGTFNSPAAEDTDFDGIGDGTILTDVLTDFNKTIDVSAASSIEITIEFSLNSGDEDIALDNIRLVDGFVASPTVTITSPSDGQTLAPGTTNVDIEFITNNLATGDQVEITVNSTTTPNVTSPFNITNTTDGTTYNVQVDVISGGSSVANDAITFEVGQAIQVANIAALRQGLLDGTIYQLTGEAVITYQQGFRNQKYIQDSSAGIQIDDNSGNITTTYNVGDGLTGLVGTLDSFNGLLQFIPVGDPGSATSTGNVIQPQIITISEFNTNFENYEAELVAFENISFTTADGTLTFDNGNTYPIEDASANSTLVEAFFNRDYTGEVVPSGILNIVGIAAEENNGEFRIFPRDLADIDVTTLGVNDLKNSTFSIYPNPVRNGFFNIRSINNNKFDIEIYNLLGKRVVQKNDMDNQTINVNTLQSGVYLVKINQDQQSITKKLIIK